MLHCCLLYLMRASAPGQHLFVLSFSFTYLLKKLPCTMPFATRKMVQYMKENGMSNAGEDSSSGSNSDVVVISNAASKSSAASNDGGAAPKNKKIRELPSSVDPPDDDDSMAKKPSKAKSSAGSKANGKSKSATSTVSSKPNLSKNSSATSSKSAASKSKSVTCGKASKSKTSTKSGTSKKKTTADEKKKPKSAKITTVPASSMALRPVMVTGVNYDEMSFDKKKVQFIQALLKSNVKSIKELDASQPYEEAKKAFEMYSVEEEKPVAGRKPHSAKALYECKHKEFPPECLVVCKLYDAKGEFDAKKSMYLKTLRHLGKKHPNIVQTWDVFAKDGTIYVFQELAPYGSMADYTKKKGALTEKETVEVAKCMRNGLDFLGDMGISHRSISPRHVLLFHKDMRVKLSGFRSAIIYYDENRHDINYQACIPVDKRSKEGDYQAPEVYGNPSKEQFDPIMADIWSFGACIYNFLSLKYPYDASKHSPNMENEIQGNVRALKVSDNAKNLIGFTLTIESTKRFSTDKLKEHPWLKEMEA